MNGECLVQSVVHRGTVRSQDTEKDYTGLTASVMFKQRFNMHQHSMHHHQYQHFTTLSNYAENETVLFNYAVTRSFIYRMQSSNSKTLSNYVVFKFW